MLKVKIVNDSGQALPAYATEGAAGLDLRAKLEAPLTLGSLERCLVPTGIYIQLPAGYEAQIRPRSGLAIKHGLTLLNTPGTIDSDYTGEIKIIMVNLSKENYQISPGERIAQMVVAAYQQVDWEEVQELQDTARSSGGFGSTGK